MLSAYEDKFFQLFCFISLDLYMSDSSRAGFPIFSCSSPLHLRALSPIHVETLLLSPILCCEMGPPLDHQEKQLE